MINVETKLFGITLNRRPVVQEDHFSFKKKSPIAGSKLTDVSRVSLDFTEENKMRKSTQFIDPNVKGKYCKEYVIKEVVAFMEENEVDRFKMKTIIPGLIRVFRQSPVFQNQ